MIHFPDKSDFDRFLERTKNLSGPLDYVSFPGSSRLRVKNVGNAPLRAGYLCLFANEPAAVVPVPDNPAYGVVNCAVALENIPPGTYGDVCPHGFAAIRGWGFTDAVAKAIGLTRTETVPPDVPSGMVSDWDPGLSLSRRHIIGYIVLWIGLVGQPFMALTYLR